MKILVISDSHRAFNNLLKMYKKEKPDIVIFAGDHSNDAIDLSYSKEDAKYYIVKGNTDYSDHDTPVRMEFEIEGFKFLLVHGHLHGVKSTYENILREAKSIEADIIVFGHTHNKLFENILGIYMFNPGSAKDGSYGTIEIKNGELYFQNKELGSRFRNDWFI